MSEEEQIAKAIRESLETFKQEESRRRIEKQDNYSEDDKQMASAMYKVERRRRRTDDGILAAGPGAGHTRALLEEEERQRTIDDEMLAKALQETFNSLDVDGFDSSYQRHQQHYGYPNMSKSERKRDRRIVLLGMTGSGKSSSGNSIVGRNVFKSSGRASSETFYGQHASATLQGRNVLVVDTPGLFDTRQNNDDTMREITRRVTLSAPGPHALILVVAGGNRTSEQTQRCAEIILEVFGKQAIRYMVILFTRLDDITHDGDDLDTFVGSLPQKMKEILAKCGNRYAAFNNRTDSALMKAVQVNDLLALIDRVVDANDGRCFTNDVYKDFKKMVVVRKKNIKEKYEMEREMVTQQIKGKFEKQKQVQEVNMEREKRKRLEAEAKHRAQLERLEDHYNQQIQRLNEERKWLRY